MWVVVWLTFYAFSSAKSVAEVVQQMGLFSLGNQKWYIQGACSSSGDGLYEGLDWLAQSLPAGLK